MGKMGQDGVDLCAEDAQWQISAALPHTVG
jgi:hypothetical protein